MAKKKRTTKKKSPRAKGKKTASKTRSTKATGRSSSSRKPAIGSRNSSVDLLLKRFAKERTQKESQLESLRKIKLDLEEKARKFQEQITNLAQQERDTRTQIAQLDKQRDEEVSQLLSKLGIQLGGAMRNPEPSREQIVNPSENRMKHSRDRGSLPTPNGRNENH